MVRVRVPATAANLGPGFDVMGMALEIYNVVEMQAVENGLEIVTEGEGSDTISTSEDNIVYRVAERVFREGGRRPQGLKIRLENAIPTSRGLGSSGAALVGGAVAANEISGAGLPRDTLINIAAEMEGHPDNVVPAMLGGITVCAGSNGTIIHRRIEAPENLRVVVAVPDFELATSDARNVLPKSVPMSDATFNLGRVSLLNFALANGDLGLLRDAMQDRIHQPYRLPLVPGMEEVFAAALEAGALGVALSGAGPTLIALASDASDLVAIGDSMRSTFIFFGVECSIRQLRPDSGGAIIIDDSGGMT